VEAKKVVVVVVVVNDDDDDDDDNNNNNKLYRKTKMLTIHGQHHPEADIDYLYVPRKEGGRGLMQIEGAYIAEVIKLEYVERKEDSLVEIVRMHNHNTNLTFLQAVEISRSLFKVKQSN
jgi:hypothetical protein